MPRENRQKLHKRLRLAAEARKAEAAEARKAATAARLRAEAAVHARLHPKPVTAGGPVVDQVAAVVGTLLRLAGVGSPVRDRVHRLLPVFRRHLGGLYRGESLPLLLLLAQEPWVREPEHFRPRRSGLSGRRDELAAWLYARAPAPPFLLGALDTPAVAIGRVPEENAWPIRLYAWLGRGGRSAHALRAGLVPAPLTQRMLHHFLQARAGTEVVAALRQAQVRVMGGSRRLADALVGTALGELRGPAAALGERFWAEVIQWFCRWPELGRAEVQALVPFIAERRLAAVRQATEWSIKGRTPDSLERARQAWARLAQADPTPWPASGLVGWAEGGVEISELRTVRALRAEGTAMHHCAGMYAPVVGRGRVSIWSMRRGEERVATIEVVHASGRVVQVKAACNTEPAAEDLQLVGRWAERNQLRMALR